jgi:hypothetical protein
LTLLLDNLLLLLLLLPTSPAACPRKACLLFMPCVCVCVCVCRVDVATSTCAESGYTRVRVMCDSTDSKRALAWNSLYGCGFLQVSCAVCSGGLRAASGVTLAVVVSWRGVPCRGCVVVEEVPAGRADRGVRVCVCSRKICGGGGWLVGVYVYDRPRAGFGH